MTNKAEHTSTSNAKDFTLHLITEEEWRAQPEWETQGEAQAAGKLKWYNGEEEQWHSTEWVWKVTGQRELDNNEMKHIVKRLAAKFMYHRVEAAEGADMNDFQLHSITAPLDYHWIVAVTDPLSLCEDLLHVVRWEY